MNTNSQILLDINEESNINNEGSLKDSWLDLTENFIAEFGKNSYDNWISKIVPTSFNGYELTLAVPTRFIKEWVGREYLDGKSRLVDGQRIWIKKGIKQIWQDRFQNTQNVELIIDEKLEGNSNTLANEEKAETKSFEKTSSSNSNASNVASISKYNNVHALGIELNPKYTFENFVVGQTNKLAFSMAKNIAISKVVDADSNPLFLYSGVGLGKTHLLQSIAWEIKESCNDKVVVYLSAERFMYHFVKSLREQSIMEFKERFRSIDVLIIDDIQFIAGKTSTQEEFFHTFNALIDANKQIILACDKCPRDLTGIDDRLKSRISGGMVVDIYTPDYDLRVEILRSKIKMLDVEVGDDVLEFIAKNINTNIRDLESAVKKLVISHKICGDEINIATAKQILKDLLKISNEAITIEKIQEATAKYFGLTVEKILSAQRSKDIATARQVAMYLSKKLTTNSFPSIGKKFGGKNHATVIHSINKIEAQIENDDKLRQDVFNINSNL